MNDFMDYMSLMMKKLIDRLTSSTGYTTLFKGAVVLSTLCLISLQQVFTLALPIESEAYKLKYEVEFSTQKQYESINSMVCNLQEKTYAKCKLAIYKATLVSSSFDALYTWLKLFSYLSALMFIFSLIGFFANLHSHEACINKLSENQEK